MSVNKDSGIWGLDTAKKRHRYDPKLAEGILYLYKSATSIADLGCGKGDYCKFLKEHRINTVHGYEGTPDIKEIAAYDDIMILDLTKRRWVEIYYSLVLALEVGEHIPKKFEQVFIDNVCEFTKKDLVLSWGIPGQGGVGHFNEQTNEYIISEFVRRGFRFEKKRTRFLREKASLRWFKKSVLVFRR
jgi:hypothetical protein